MTTTTETLVDTCPDCGFAFPRPQARCRVAAACKRRQAARSAVEPVADALADAAPAETAAPVKVKLTSAGQEALVDEILPGQPLRSGRAGHWLVIHADEIDAVTAIFARPAATPVGETLARKVTEALAA